MNDEAKWPEVLRLLLMLAAVNVIEWVTRRSDGRAVTSAATKKR